jgi:hypothetical protein
MKLDVEVSEIEVANVGAKGEFKIRNSAKAFKILSDGLYSNKIKAVVRELSCNAVDSHMAAGKSDVPFLVHLPSMMEPWFSVQDYGTGLDGSQITDIYTTYFESTKTDSNDYIGALGLGSKSPFSYTENFTVTAIKDGTKRIYSAFINEMGVPSIVEMSVLLTDDINGVEVKFSVTNQHDYDSFRYEAQAVFSWFKVQPIVEGSRYQPVAITYAESNISPGVHTYNGHSVALMGNIAYPLSKLSEPERHFGKLASLLNCNLVLEFKIGEIDFAASREELSYVPLTIRSIKRKLEELNANLSLHVAAKVDALGSEWEKAFYLQSITNSKLYKSAADKYVTDTKFKLFSPDTYHGTYTFNLPVADNAAKNIAIDAFRSSASHSSRIDTVATRDSKGNVSWSRQIPVDKDVMIVLNDLKIGCASRAKYHCTENSMSKTVFCVSYTDTKADAATRDAAFDELIKELHYPPMVVRASDLDKRVPVVRTPLSTTGIMYLESKSVGNYSWDKRVTYVWSQFTTPLEDTTKYYYVCLSNYSSETLDGKSFDTLHLKILMIDSGIPDIANIVVVGVRKSRIKDIKNLPNWIWIEDKLNEEVAKITDLQVAGLVSLDIIDHYNNHVYNKIEVAALLPSTSDYTKYVAQCKDIPRTTGNTTRLVELCSKYGKVLKAESIKQEYKDRLALLAAKYPMLRYLDSATPVKLIADYINSIDIGITI